MSLLESGSWRRVSRSSKAAIPRRRAKFVVFSPLLSEPHRELYAIEKAIKAEIAKIVPEDETDESQRAAIRLRIRQERAVPVLERFRKWLEAEKPNVLPKSPISGAIGYVQNHWEALIRYASSGYLAIDNNVADQHMKIITT